MERPTAKQKEVYPISSLLQGSVMDLVDGAEVNPAVEQMVEVVGEYEHGTAEVELMFDNGEDAICIILRDHYRRNLPTTVDTEDPEEVDDYINQMVQEQLLLVTARVVYEMALIIQSS